jgi:hypothetical protein
MEEFQISPGTTQLQLVIWQDVGLIPFSSSHSFSTSGYANEITKEMYNFDFEMKEHSSFDLTNALWEMIGENMPEIAADNGDRL